MSRVALSEDTHSNAAQIIVMRARQGRHAEPFLKGEGEVLRVLKIRVEVLYVFPACCVAE
jgi:hypothetical protein